MHSRIGRIAGAAAISTLGVVGIAGTAFAHIEPDPVAAQEGTAVTVDFSVEHGCAGSPTTGLDIKMPDGITDAKAVDKQGWTATVDSGVVRFVGRSPSGEAPDTFSITFTAPTTPGDVHFPTVQKCLEGSTDWLDIAQDGQPAPEHPAPTMKITAGPPSAADLTPPPDDDADAEPATDSAGTGVQGTAVEGTAVQGTSTPSATALTAASDGAAAATTVPAVAATATPTVTAVVTDTTSAPSSDGGSNTGLVVGIVIAAVVVIGGGGLLAVRARAKRATR